MRLARTKIPKLSNYRNNKRFRYMASCHESECHRNYLARRDEPPIVTSQQKFSPDKREWWDTVFYVPLQKITARWWSGGLSMTNILGIENRICCFYCKLCSSGCAIALHQIGENGVCWTIFSIFCHCSFGVGTRNLKLGHLVVKSIYTQVVWHSLLYS